MSQIVIRDRIREFRRVPVAELQANARNFRTHPKAQRQALDGLLHEVGIADALIAYESERYGGLTLIDGHLRIETDVQEWPVLILDVDDVEADLLLASMDPLAAMAGTDAETLDHLLRGITTTDAGVQSMLSSLAETAGLYRDRAGQGNSGDDFDCTPSDGPTRTQAGDLWQLGDHLLLVGDCTDPANVARLMEGVRGALCFTSPPYNVGDNAVLMSGATGAETKYIAGDEDDLSGEAYLQLLCAFTEAALAHCDYAMVNLQMVAGNKLTVVEYLHRFRDHLADVAIWNKGHAAPAMATKVMNSQFEFLFGFIFSPKELPSRAIGTRHFRGTLPNVYSAGGQRENEFADVHNATFPLHLPTHWIENLTRWHDVVYDPFGGTGTTLIACERTARLCRMMEKSPAYADIVLKRWESESGREAVQIIGWDMGAPEGDQTVVSAFSVNP